MYDIDLIFDPLLNPLKLLHDLNPFFVNLFLSYLLLVRVLHEIFPEITQIFFSVYPTLPPAAKPCPLLCDISSDICCVFNSQYTNDV